MKILVLGAKSFLAKEIKSYFKDDKRFYYSDRSTIDLENSAQVDDLFNKHYFDFVINTCSVGGKLGIQDNFSVLSKNLSMFNNLLKNRNKYGYLFNFCSGAAFDRSYPISEVKEDYIVFANPKDFYGLSKKIIASESLKHNNIFTFRLFGCFGKFESEGRLLKNIILAHKNNTEIKIVEGKVMDYISATDVCRVLEYYINNISLPLYKDINLVYNEKITLEQFAETALQELSSYKKYSLIEGSRSPYTGDSKRLSTLPIKLIGLRESIKEVIKNG